MTETTETSAPLPAALERFVVHWGEMGETWGVNRSVAQIHALLFVADGALAAEDIAAQLGLARSNVSNSLRELLAWNLIRRVQVLGDRRDFYAAESDMFEMVRRIALGRKAREIEPAIGVLEACLDAADKDRRVSPAARKRLADMLDVTRAVERSFTEIITLPSPVLGRLIRMGGAVARLIGKGPAGRRIRR
ncbi:MAG: GbsR/MarR family transcriptional regulator [Hyphomicrobium sp.]